MPRLVGPMDEKKENKSLYGGSGVRRECAIIDLAPAAFTPRMAPASVAKMQRAKFTYTADVLEKLSSL